jgi:peptide-methionine (S)-S-oxide reductase
MRRIGFAGLALALVAGALIAAAPPQKPTPVAAASARVTPPHMAEAVFGGGCFWCLEAAFEQLRGVEDVSSGYADGRVPSPTYEAVCAGKTGHAEVVRVVYDPKAIGYDALLRAFFVIHDPTTVNRQGNDVGDQYRSVILTRTPAQAQAARALITRLTAEKAFARAIVTEVKPLKTFYMAEDEHQDYFARHPEKPYCAFVVAPKVKKLREAFYDQLKR